MGSIDEFSEDESYILVIPSSNKDKPVKIVCEGDHRIEPTDDPMKYVLTWKTTLNTDVTTEELIEQMLKDGWEKIEKSK